MTPCEETIEQLHDDARVQVHLAVVTSASPAAAMHLDLARFSETQARIAEEICTD